MFDNGLHEGWWALNEAVCPRTINSHVILLLPLLQVLAHYACFLLLAAGRGLAMLLLQHFSVSPLLEWSAAVLFIRLIHVLLAFDPNRHHFPSVFTISRWRFVWHHFVIQIGSRVAATKVVETALRSLLQASLDGYRQFGSGKNELVAAAHLINDWVLWVCRIANRTNCSLLWDLDRNLRAELWYCCGSAKIVFWLEWVGDGVICLSLLLNWFERLMGDGLGFIGGLERVRARCPVWMITWHAVGTC